MSDFKVTVEYKNKSLETVVEKEYSFFDYTEMISLDIKRVLMDIEDAFYYFSGNKQKQDWDPELTDRFNKIRHKLLDQANAVKRMPDNLSYKGIKASAMNFGEYLARTLDK